MEFKLESAFHFIDGIKQVHIDKMRDEVLEEMSKEDFVGDFLCRGTLDIAIVGMKHIEDSGTVIRIKAFSGQYTEYKYTKP